MKTLYLSDINRNYKPPFEYTQRYGLNRRHPMALDLVVGWLFNEGAGNSVIDISGNNRTGILQNNTTWRGVGGLGVCLTFDNIAEDWVDCGDISALFDITQSWTMFTKFIFTEAVTSLDDFPTVMTIRNPANTNQIAISTHNGNIKITTDGETPGAGSALTIGGVHTAALTWDGTNFDIYLDGVFDYQVTPSGSNWQQGTDVAFGRELRAQDDFFEGQIGCGYLWQRLFTANDILQLHVNPYAPLELADYPFGFVAGGGITVTPAPASCITEKVDPTTVLGSISYTPSSAGVLAATLDPLTILGGISLTPSPASAITAIVNPTVIAGGGVTITPVPADCVAGKVDPAIVLGSLSITPGISECTALTIDPNIITGSIVITPNPVQCVADTVNPGVVLGTIIIVPVPAELVADVIDPGIILGSLSITPSASAVVVDTVDPTVIADILQILSENLTVKFLTTERSIVSETLLRSISSKTLTREVKQ